MELPAVVGAQEGGQALLLAAREEPRPAVVGAQESGQALLLAALEVPPPALLPCLVCGADLSAGLKAWHLQHTYTEATNMVLHQRYDCWCAHKAKS